jgi:ATP-binding cassette subfamily A (ABC1) protein 3
MLTGLLNKTEGKAVAFNTDLFENMADVRQFMGVCPQHDVLFDQLTPIEHLQLFYELKGGVNDPIKKA